MLVCLEGIADYAALVLMPILIELIQYALRIRAKASTVTARLLASWIGGVVLYYEIGFCSIPLAAYIGSTFWGSTAYLAEKRSEEVKIMAARVKGARENVEELRKFLKREGHKRAANLITSVPVVLKLIEKQSKSSGDD